MGISRELLDQVRRLVHPIAQRVANSIARAVVDSIDDAKKLQMLQIGVLADETLDDAERFQEYGFTSVPIAGAEAVVVFPGGDRAHPLVVAVDDRRYRVTGLQSGEVAVYNSAGAKVVLKASGDIEVTPGTSGGVKLGGSAAAAGVIRGTERNTAEQTFLTAMATFVAAIVDVTGAPAAAKTTFGNAIGTFATAAGLAVSTKVKAL